ncbi:hypothetical protein GCM10009801_00330 [Streptomyces albiaxialis]|uniref:Uncharacterized protein n=1 Tax=Streptomyces albiaxialis TaxID=329523 RepID=A0ABN2VCX5_9ACTN
MREHTAAVRSLSRFEVILVSSRARLRLRARGWSFPASFAIL